MEFEFWWLLLFVLFFGLGWFSARIDIKQILNEYSKFPAVYLKGLNFLISEQADKAIEVFSEAIKVDSNALELHLALGSLFRKKGELEQAIRLHTALLQHTTLTHAHIVTIKAELAQDYLKAGLLDRAEQLFSALQHEANYAKSALHALLEIYEREREWQKAIGIATQLEQVLGTSFHIRIAHYYCEMASYARSQSDAHSARANLHQALHFYPQCVRATILMGELEWDEQAYKSAVLIWQRIEQQNPAYLGMVADNLLSGYRLIQQLDKGIALLTQYLNQYQIASIRSALYNYILQEQGSKVAMQFALSEFNKSPSLTNLYILLDPLNMDTSKMDYLPAMRQTIYSAMKNRTGHQCQQCGFMAKYHHWQCPACNTWETLAAEPRQA